MRQPIRTGHDVGWLLVLLITVFAVAPLGAPGFFLKAHDATIGAYFLWQFDRGIADGALYPRWAMDWTYGYGYPLFVIIAPLAFYVAQVFHLLGAGIVGALKATYALALLGSGLSMYLLGRELFGRSAGLLAGALYIYAPYHLLDIYVRADVAEFAAFAFFPALLWAIRRLVHAQEWRLFLRYVGLGGLLFGSLILTHITMAMLFTPVALAFALCEIWKPEDRVRDAGSVASAVPVSAVPRRPISSSARVAASLLTFAIGGAIGAMYLVPGFLEQRYLQARDLVGGYFSYVNHYVYPHQFFSSFWGYGYAAIGPDDQMSYQLGLVPVVLALCSLCALRSLDHSGRRYVLFFVIISACAVLAMLSISQPLWDLLRPCVAFVQFPWRLLAVTSLSLALVGAGIVGTGGMRQAAPLVIVVLLAGYAMAAPQYTDADVSLTKMIQYQLDTKEMLGDTIWVTERPDGSPMVADYLASRPPTRVIPDDARTSITVLHSGGVSYEILVTAPAPTDILFRIRYFPGWRAYVDGKPVDTGIRPPQGLMAVRVPEGEHRVLLRFEDTTLRVIGKLLSGVGLLAAGGLCVASLIIGRRTGRS